MPRPADIYATEEYQRRAQGIVCAHEQLVAQLAVLETAVPAPEGYIWCVMHDHWPRLVRTQTED